MDCLVRQPEFGIYPDTRKYSRILRREFPSSDLHLGGGSYWEQNRSWIRERVSGEVGQEATGTVHARDDGAR